MFCLEILDENSSGSEGDSGSGSDSDDESESGLEGMSITMSITMITPLAGHCQGGMADLRLGKAGKANIWSYDKLSFCRKLLVTPTTFATVMLGDGQCMYFCDPTNKMAAID